MNFIPKRSHRYAYTNLCHKGAIKSFIWESDQWDVFIFRHGFGFPRDIRGILQARIQNFFVNNLNGIGALKHDCLDGKELPSVVADAFSQFWEWVDSYELHP